MRKLLTLLLIRLFPRLFLYPRIINGPVPGTGTKKDKFWEFKNLAESEAELLLYGEIASERPWWDWEGETVTQKQFIEELKALGTKSKITVRISSPGGDVWAATAIYTQLKSNPAYIEVIIDGVCASAATIVAMAGDVVKTPSNALWLPHNPRLLPMEYLEAKDLRKYADDLDKVKEAIVNGYANKTKKDKKDLAKMMDKAEWMTGEDAVNEGFADELMFSDLNIAMKGNVLLVNNISYDLSGFKNMPRLRNAGATQSHEEASFIQRFMELLKGASQMPAQNLASAANTKNTEEVEETMEIKTVDDLKKAYPDLVNQVEKAASDNAAKAERTRIQDIEKISKNVDPALVNKAKFEEPVDAKELAFQAMQKDQKIGTEQLQAAQADTAASGTNSVAAAPVNNAGDNKPKTLQDRFKNVAASFDARRRGAEK